MAQLGDSTAKGEWPYSSFIFHPSSFSLSSLEARFEKGVKAARRLNEPVLISFTERIEGRDGLDFFARARHLAHDSFFWSNPATGFSITGVGAAYKLEGYGRNRYREVARQWQNLLAHAHVDNRESVWGTGPALIGGFSFDPRKTDQELWYGFGDATLVLPRLQLTTTQTGKFLTVNAILSPYSDAYVEARLVATLYSQLSSLIPYPSPLPTHPSSLIPHPSDDIPSVEEWMASVDEAVEHIRAGEFEKVVLAREVRICVEEDFKLEEALGRLQNSYPTSFVFAIAKGDRCFMGATPERLVRLDNGELRTTALAGSIARGATAEQDQQLADELFNSQKNRHEHQFVVDMLKRAVESVAEDVQAPTVPEILKLANLQHLYTPITGRIAPDHNILDLVAQLHPTPAVGGFPRAEAVEFIRQHEQLNRGWYAAPVGWFDWRGDGEFAVALRSALVEENCAHLFAGCGIVADSRPEAEYQETLIKLKAMQTAFGE